MNNIFEQMLSKYEIRTKADELNALHEVMQEITLAALYRSGFFENAAFYGGTCLRIFHKLPRFSEDLDFSLFQKNDTFSLNTYFSAIETEFMAYGRQVELVKKEKKVYSSVDSAFHKDNTEVYNIQFKTEKTVKIKIEVDKDPPPNFNTEYKLLLLPFSFMVRCFDIPSLFAGKMHAILFREWKGKVKGRDWYDLEWYVRHNHLLDFERLKTRSMQKGFSGTTEFTKEIFIELLKEKIRKTDIKQVIADVRPFVKNINELSIWSPDYFLQLVNLIQFKEN
ncbi:MAG: nucleotidyl transferase AbiEii/AbiGii toxin family protein [Bacteroidales bacterium]|nr:nucleotidyl transferase AbiEii/AbiGii toxin family protein [Bacteroidales bacterium]